MPLGKLIYLQVYFKLTKNVSTMTPRKFSGAWSASMAMALILRIKVTTGIAANVISKSITALNAFGLNLRTNRK